MFQTFLVSRVSRVWWPRQQEMGHDDLLDVYMGSLPTTRHHKLDQMKMFKLWLCGENLGRGGERWTEDRINDSQSQSISPLFKTNSNHVGTPSEASPAELGYWKRPQTEGGMSPQPCSCTRLQTAGLKAAAASYGIWTWCHHAFALHDRHNLQSPRNAGVTNEPENALTLPEGRVWRRRTGSKQPAPNHQRWWVRASSEYRDSADLAEYSTILAVVIEI